MVVPMIFGPLTRRRYGLSRRFERAVEFFAVGTALFFNSCNLLVAAYNLIENPGTLEPVTLFYTSVGIWFGNILIFTLILLARRRRRPRRATEPGSALPRL